MTDNVSYQSPFWEIKNIYIYMAYTQTHTSTTFLIFLHMISNSALIHLKGHSTDFASQWIYSMTQKEPFQVCFCLRDLGASQTNNDFLWRFFILRFSVSKTAKRTSQQSRI